MRRRRLIPLLALTALCACAGGRPKDQTLDLEPVKHNVYAGPLLPNPADQAMLQEALSALVEGRWVRWSGPDKGSHVFFMVKESTLVGGVRTRTALIVSAFEGVGAVIVQAQARRGEGGLWRLYSPHIPVLNDSAVRQVEAAHAAGLAKPGKNAPPESALLAPCVKTPQGLFAADEFEFPDVDAKYNAKRPAEREHRKNPFTKAYDR